MFEKYQATGNDFILSLTEPHNPASFAKSICDRHFGIGADGFIYPVPSTKAAIGMKYFNSDGSEAPMCGNGMRAFVRFIYSHELVSLPTFSVETLGGIIEVSQNKEHIALNLGAPILTHHIPYSQWLTHTDKALHFSVDGRDYDLHLITLGTIHGVIFVKSYEEFDFDQVGHTLSTHPFFLKGVNVNFVRIVDESTLEVRTYERGAGPTLSCGTGVGASAYVAHRVKQTSNNLDVHVAGGHLQVKLGKQVVLIGPAEKIATIDYEGEG